ncbi:chloroplast stem-loop binding protein of 41 kDa b, chloroplastic [Tanacetum coccineum]
MLGLDGAFIKGLFPGQVLAVVGHDSNNEIYPLAYALVEAESKSSWCWFLQCLGDDIDLHPNSNFTFINDRQKGIIPALATVFPSAKHIYCLRHIHENMKQGWCGQAYKDLLWRSASVTSVKEFKKCMLKLKKMNPKAHEWLNKILPEHWARSYFLGRAKSDLLVNNICEVFNGKIVGGRDKTRETYSRKVEPVNGTNYWEKSCPTTLLPPKYHVQVGRPKKKRKRNIGHIMATCKGQGRKATTGGNNAEASGSASRKAQQAKHVVGQNGSGGSGVGAVIGLFVADCAGGASVGIGSQGSSHTRWTKRRVETVRISPQKTTLTQLAS